MKDNKEKAPLFFAALDPYIESNIVLPVEKTVNGKDYVQFGEGDQYPFYIYDLYTQCPVLSSIINTTTDYVSGDDVISNLPIMEDKELTELVRNIALDKLIYGGCYLQVVRNRIGGIAQVKTVDFRYMRSNADNSLFYYSENFGQKWGRGKMHIYPKFDKDAKDPVSIYFVKNSVHTVYPLPIWNSATIYAEIQKNIGQYHLNSIYNNFSSSAIVSFLNGIPSDEVREEIEAMFEEKYTGFQNAGRTIVNFAQDKDHSVDIQKLDTADFGDKYNTLAQRSENQLFIAFRAPKNLFGGVFDGIGFNTQEYSSCFKLYNKVAVQPLQKEIVDIIADITDVENPLTIVPFAINFDEENNDVKVIND